MFSGQQRTHLGTQNQVVLEIEYKFVESKVMRKFAKKTLSRFHYNQQTNENIYYVRRIQKVPAKFKATIQNGNALPGSKVSY